ncbi:MAG: hypothetical protein Q7U18_02890 [Methylobacter sp.]|nr:hypothetical protein [Methylobacter sp.]
MDSGSSWNTLDAVTSVLTWLDWLGLAVVLILLCVLGFLIWRRKYPKSGSKLAIPELIVPTKLLLPPNCLLTVWRYFISAIPWRLRPNALRMPLSLVIGEAGCGKTGIIDCYADWQGQNFRFHPSATDDPLLQIYLGAKSLVLEFASSLLYDTSPAAYTAIKKLWRHLPPSPQAVMVIDATTLLSPKMEQLRQSGHALFGKLKVFGELEREPLPLIIALTHMEKIPGFVEFCLFLQEAGIPLQLDFPEGDGINRLESCLDGYQEHLRRALVTCPAQDYLKIVGFLKEVPTLFNVLGDFLRVAGLEQDVASPPIVRLCLLSEHVHSFGCHPFSLPPGIVEKPRFTLNGHAKAALALLLAGSVYLVGSYHYQQNMVTQVYEDIQTIPTIPVQHYAEKISPLFLNFSADLNKDALLTFMPNFFEPIVERNNYLLIAEIRKYYLVPLLKLIQLGPDANFKTTRFIGLLYATPTNEMGKIIEKTAEKNPVDIANIGKYAKLISDYRQYNTRTEELDFLLNEITYAKPQTYIEDNTLWIALFHNFQQLLNKPFVQEAEFKTLQQQLVPFLHIIDRLDYYSDEEDIRQWLTENTSLRLMEQRNQSQLRQRDIAQLLTLVSNLKLDHADNCKVALSLNECLGLVQAVANAKIDSTSSDMTFSLDGEQFSFNPAQWNALIKRSRISMMLRDVINNHRNYDGWLFFGFPSIYANVEMNATNNGGMLFAGKASIDGRMTADAFEQDVKPAIIALSEIVDKLPIDRQEKKYFNDFVLKSLGTYSDGYVKAYLHYFQQFQVRIDSTWALTYVLSDLQQPASSLLETLVQIKNNTALNFPVSPYFQPFAQKLTTFRFIQRLMEEQNGVYPEFQKYQFLMAQMQYDISTEEPYMPKKGDTAGALKGALTPIGRVAWSMLLNEDGSYATLVKNWLQNVGILNDWQQPFLAPVQKVQKFGTNEINQHVAAIWSDIWSSNVMPLLVKFPFTSNAGRDKELALDDLSATFHPIQGVFWITFQQYLSPLSTFSNGVWIKHRELSDSVVLPPNYLKRINAAQQLTASLWDDVGNPKPLELSVRPGLLPTYKNQKILSTPLVSLTYLRQGENSVLGFNQQKTWQTLAVKWWSPQLAEVGMEFRKDAAPTRVYSDITVTDSQWNFFRLLQQGELVGAQRYRWLLAHPNFPQQSLNIEFSFQANPLAVFANLAGS